MPNDALKFTGPPSATKRRATADIPDAVLPTPDDQGDVVLSMSPDQEALSDLLPDPVPAEPPAGTRLLIHVLEDGFTAHGQVWYRGQEIEYRVGEKAYEDTKDRSGVTWLFWDDQMQMRRWGQLMFRHGPWPGSSYEDPRAAAAERARTRRPPVLAGVAPPMTGR
jgi:hypothetical protein